MEFVLFVCLKYYTICNFMPHKKNDAEIQIKPDVRAEIAIEGQ
jgi:hypothetical protein